MNDQLMALLVRVESLEREVSLLRTLLKGSRFIHGEAGKRSPEYRAWINAKRRCYNINNHNFERYGGRGIVVCERWAGPNGFAHFLADMGRRPSNEHSLDRIDNDGNYEPRNCRWATREEQADNKTSRRKLTILQVRRIKTSLNKGETHRSIAERFGISATTVGFIHRGRTWKKV